MRPKQTASPEPREPPLGTNRLGLRPASARCPQSAAEGNNGYRWMATLNWSSFARDRSHAALSHHKSACDGCRSDVTTTTSIGSLASREEKAHALENNNPIIVISF